MRLGLLGALEVDDAPPCNLAPRAANVLAVLGLHSGSAVSADTIEAFIWGEQPPPTARKSVQVAISELRRCFGTDSIGTTERGYVLHGADVDVVSFERGCRRGHDLLSDDQPWAAADVLEASLALWRGDPLVPLIDHADGQSIAASLEERRSCAEEDLVDAQLACGRHRDIVPTLRAAVEAAPFRERRWSQLMLAFHRSGRKAEALESYQELSRRLGDELGVEPGPEVIALEESILLNKPELDWRPGDAGATPTAPEPRSVGHRFVGRRSELATLRSELARSQLVTVTGPGGVGKTRLAMQAATSLTDCRDGALFVDLTGAKDRDEVADAWLRAGGIAERVGERRDVALLEANRHLDQLVVLDNCEHVRTDCAELLATILPEAPRLRVLATSREALGVPHELVVVLEPLGLSTEQLNVPEDALRSEAVALLLDRWTERDHLARLDEETAPLLCALAQRVEGLPLALELVAARLPAVALDDLDRRLATDTRLLDRSTSSTRAHQDTLRAAIGWSYDLLEPPDRVALARLSVFVGGCQLDEAEAVLTLHGEDDAVDVLGCLESLVAKCLVQFTPDGTSGRYLLLDLIRTFAHETIEVGERDRLRDHHATAYLNLAERLKPQYGSLRQPIAHARTTPELDNFRRARDRLVDSSDRPLAALRLIVALLPYFQVHSLSRECQDWFDASWDESAPPQLRLEAFMYLSSVKGDLGDNRGGRDLLEQGLELAIATDDVLWQAIYYSGRALTAIWLENDVEQALRDNDRAIELARRSTTTGRPLTFAIQLKGNLLRFTPDRHRVRELLEDALDLARLGGPTGAISSILGDVVQCDFEDGKFEDALVHVKEMGDYASEVPCDALVCAAQLFESYARLRLGDDEGALACVLEGTRLHVLQRSPNTTASLALQQGFVLAQSDPLRAARCIGISEGLAERHDHRPVGVWADDLPGRAGAIEHTLGSDAYRDAVAGGRAMSYDDAVTYLLGDYRGSNRSVLVLTQG
jgi:predicted ATPase/DNA-binding SARP family transcriptional activator